MRLTIADQAFSGYIRSVQDDQAVMILVSKTGHPDGWLWLNTDKIQAIDSQTPDLALQASFIDIYRHRQPSFDPQQLPVPAITLHDWLRLANDRQTMLYLGLAHTSEWATVSQKKRPRQPSVTIIWMHWINLNGIHWKRLRCNLLSAGPNT